MEEAEMLVWQSGEWEGMMETARVTARQVAESLSVQELRESAKDFRNNRGLEVMPSTEDIAQLLEYIADLRDEAENV